MISLPRLYAVADRKFGNPADIAQALFAGGAQIVQIRDKDAGARTLLDEVEAVIKVAPPGVRIIVNDRADVAKLAAAAGVHLGQEDLSPALARTVLDQGQIIGNSTHNLAQALEADKSSADYIAVGPVFQTTTKSNPDPVVGLERLREICQRVQKPVVAIGGITMESAKDVFGCGVTSVAVIGDLLKHGDIVERTREWVRRLDF